MAAIAGEPPKSVGVVFQEDASFPWLTVTGNVAFGLRRSGLPAAEIDKRVSHAIELMGLAQFRTAYPSQLSGGMRRKVELARALLSEPQLLLMDEATVGIDPASRNAILNDMRTGVKK